MGTENICCPMLNIVDCGDTDRHKHLLCIARHTIEGCVMSNEDAREFCLGKFMQCGYYPRGEGDLELWRHN